MSKHNQWVRFVVVILVAALAGVTDQQPLGAAEDASPAGTSATAHPLLGSWKMVQIEERGQKTRPPIEMVFTFEKDVVIQKIGPRAQESKYKLDAEHPAHLDVFRERGGETRVFKMLYTVEGDNLKICSGRPDAARPEKMTAEAGYSIQVFQRVPAAR